MIVQRRKTKEIKLGKVRIGGDAPISVQSMTNTDTRDVLKTVRQIKGLEREGCEIIRVAVPDKIAALGLGKIKKKIKIPLIADIQFDYQLALLALEQKVDGLRLNPGNIKDKKGIKLVARLAKEKNIPIRIGVNSGSLDKKLLEKYKGPAAEALVESALGEIRLLEDLGFEKIKVSLKSSDVPRTVKAYKLLAQKVSYPFHLGITEAGTLTGGIIKSAVGIGSLLAQGIGDTIRVSLTANPREEVRVGFEILKALELRQYGPVLISCPTCGRCQIDLIKIAGEVERELGKFPNLNLKVAVMGCPVNGPGEAREADLGIAGGKGVGLLFKKGKIIKKVEEKDLVSALMKEISNLNNALTTD